jgi:hypothetical protein
MRDWYSDGLTTCARAPPRTSLKCTLMLFNLVRLASSSSESRSLLQPSTASHKVTIPRSDLIATGGSAAAAGQLIALAGGKTLEYLFVVGLPFLKVSRRGKLVNTARRMD